MDDKQYRQLARSVGPAGVALVTHLREELWPRAIAAAEAMGFNPAEAEAAARTACAGAIRGFLNSLNASRNLRQFRH